MLCQNNAGRWRRDHPGSRVRLPVPLLGLFVGLLGLGAFTFANTPLQYIDETALASLDHIYAGPWVYFVGGGVAVFDCDGDLLPELFLAGGGDAAALYANRSEPGGSLRFAPLDRPAVELEGVTGAYPLDIDSDGLVDLAVLRAGENLLLRGTGDCQFEAVNERWGFEGGDAWTVAFAAVWERGRELPTLAVGNYVDRDAPGSPWGTCHDNELHRADATSYAAPLALIPGYCALSMRVSDWNRDGTPDLWVSNDRQYYLGGGDRSGGEQLWRLDPDAVPDPYGRDDGWDKLQIWGMGIASADLTGDGFPEFFLTSMTDQKLRILADGARAPRYRDAAFARNLTLHRPFTGGDTRPSTGWHAQFEDVDHDGIMDLFVSKGNVEAMPEFAADDPNNLLLGQPDGAFSEVADVAGALSFERGRGAQLADLNLDGRLDLVVVNRGAPVQVWRNASSGLGSWLMLRLAQDGPNPAGIGAWIEIDVGERTVRRELYVGGGHASGSWGWTHVGLAGEQEVDVRVIWPDGSTEVWQDVRAEAFVELARGGPAREISRPDTAR